MLRSAGPGLPRPSIFIYLPFSLQLQVQGVLVVGFACIVCAYDSKNSVDTGDRLPYLLLLWNPACITQINNSVLIHVVHAAGCCWGIVVVHSSIIYSLISYSSAAELIPCPFPRLLYPL